MANNLIPSSGSHRITLQEAVEMTERYRENKGKILKPEFNGRDILSICETFNKEELLQYFNKSEIHAIRLYYGMDSELKIHAILVGVNSEGQDILPLAREVQLKEDFDPELFEKGFRCPPYCPPPSELNP